MTKPLYCHAFPIWMALVFAAASISPSQAMISFGYLSPEEAEEAEEAGLEIRYRAAGPNDVWVEISFPTGEEVAKIMMSDRLHPNHLGSTIH